MQCTPFYHARVQAGRRVRIAGLILQVQSLQLALLEQRYKSTYADTCGAGTAGRRRFQQHSTLVLSLLALQVQKYKY